MTLSKHVDQTEAFQERQNHAKCFLLWHLSQTSKQSVHDILDAYEHYVEGHGASRRQRRDLTQGIEKHITRAIWGLANLKYLTEDPINHFSLTAVGKDVAKATYGEKDLANIPGLDCTKD